jgi:hypothetical protein
MDLLLQSAIGLLRIWRIELLLGVMVLLVVVILLLVVRISGRLPADGFSVLGGHLAGFDQRLHYLEEAVRNEADRSRQEAAGNARSIREELRGAVRDSGDSLLMRMAENAGMQKNQLDSFSKQLMDMTRLHEETPGGILQAGRRTSGTGLQGIGRDAEPGRGGRRLEKGAHERQDPRHMG